jgi:uncharacterized protein (DUF58 family)
VRRLIKRIAGKIPTRITKSGWWFIGVTTMTSSAAYQSGSNVLFLALACFLSALLLNGLISWWNYSKLEAKPLKTSQMQAGVEKPIFIRVEDRKTTLRSIGMEAVAQIVAPGNKAQAYRIPLTSKDEALAGTLNWTPKKRGRHSLQFKSIDSHFPFGFIRKQMPIDLTQEVLVWPSMVSVDEMDLLKDPSSEDNKPDKQRQRFAPEIASIRPFIPGDSKRVIHWKKSAQTGSLISKNQDFSSSTGPVHLWFDLHASNFASEDEFDLYCSKIGSLSSEWLRIGRIHSVRLHDEPMIVINSSAHWCQLMDRLATIEAKTTKVEFDAPIVTPELLKSRGAG